MSNLVWRLLLAKRSQKPDWRTALETTQGIYMITDKLNGKRYVGSAYGSNGIWSRCLIPAYQGYRASFGTTRPEFQILSPRPFLYEISRLKYHI